MVQFLCCLDSGGVAEKIALIHDQGLFVSMAAIFALNVQQWHFTGLSKIDHKVSDVCEQFAITVVIQFHNVLTFSDQGRRCTYALSAVGQAFYGEFGHTL